MFRPHRHHHHHHHHNLHPCLHCHPQGYIRMVQHLIERCLLLRMTPDECVKALADRANVRPLITLTDFVPGAFAVWKELQKENLGFFQAYFEDAITPRSPIYNTPQRMSKFTRKQCGGWRRVTC
ncbi:uncharacterized protein [Typha angustifolia]|uniref:uncharacterized protein isoform X2 n=1 Tax=Typha angustifolia TaxID=59011 RepID=UPI003C3007C4